MSETLPIVGVVMGSDSDFETMQKCVAQLKELGIPNEVRIISAHRTPQVAHQYAATARERGLKVIIAAAGMSAALPGVLAASTTLPVVGVPMESGALKGFDAVLSIVQMPPGVPVGSMAIGGAVNAAIFAAQILATSDQELARKLVDFKKAQTQKVQQRDAAIQQQV